MSGQKRQAATPSQADLAGVMMASLLPVHAALTPDWLVDAAATAAERGLNAPFAFVFLEDNDGRLECKAPASDLRRRSHQRALDALGTVLFRTRVDPAEWPAIAQALDESAAVTTTLHEFFAPLIGDERANEAAKSLAADTVCVTPLETAGERLGALMVLGHGETDPVHVRLLGEHIACAAVNLRNAQLARESVSVDVIRSVFDSRKLESELQRELARAVRYNREASICVIQATNLGMLRERFGQFLTDRLFQRLGELLAQRARDIDLIGVYRDSGYTMILTEASPDGAEAAARRLLQNALETSLDAGEGVPGLELHLAGGYATCPLDGTTTDSMFAAAEARMYDAQEQVA